MQKACNDFGVPFNSDYFVGLVLWDWFKVGAVLQPWEKVVEFNENNSNED
jgi:hypothetical protein